MDFNNVRVLGYSHSSNFLGDDIFRFRSDKNLSIQGTLVDLTGANKVSSGIWNEMDLLSQFSNYEPVIINGTVFGSGVMNSLSFDQGQDINLKEYTANLVIFSTGNLFNLTGIYYTGIDSSNYKYIDDLAEDFSLNTDGIKNSYSQKIAIRCHSGNGVDPLSLAKNIAANLFSVNSITGLISDYNNINSNPLFTESIDLINNAYQVEKTVSFGERSGDYSIERTHSISLAEDGFVTVEENGQIKGLKLSDPWYAAVTGANAEINTSYPRCLSVFNSYNNIVTLPLNSKVVLLSKSLNRFTDSISYSVSYSNNKRNSESTSASIENTSEIRRNERGLYEVGLRGVVQGWGKNYLIQFESAKTAFNTLVKPYFDSIVRGLLRPITFLPHKLESSNITFNQFNGSINYSYDYTTDYNYKSGSFKKEIVDISDSFKNKIINRYGLFNQKELVQKSNIYSISVRNLTLTLVGRRNIPFELYLTRARDIINAYIPNESLYVDDTFIEQLNYSFNPKNYTLSLNIVWPYTSKNNSDLTTASEESIIA